jgi:hypothetical protein
MTRWEYQMIPMVPEDDGKIALSSYAEIINMFGEMGWELITISDDVLLFKRPKESSDAQVR